MYIGHIKINDSGDFELQELDDHLEGTARLAFSFASEFQNKEWRRLLGLEKVIEKWVHILLMNRTFTSYETSSAHSKTRWN
ncbi:MAG: hypothetical protein C0397_13680 [Odoribacter sp.]|nr:hypothetical protein [Odoribacter sp.]